MSAISEATTVSLAVKYLSRKARVEAPFGADSEATLLDGKTLLNSAKLTSNGGAKALSAHRALPHGEAIPASPPAKRSASKATSKVNPKLFSPSRLIFSSLSFCVGSIRSDEHRLWEFLSNKRKSRFEEQVTYRHLSANK